MSQVAPLLNNRRRAGVPAAAWRGRRLLVAAAAFLALTMGAANDASADDPPRIDLKVLLVSADGTEPTFGLWKTTLEREGVPFDVIKAVTAPPLTAEQLADGPAHAKYQAVVLATGNLAYFDGTSWGSAFSTDEWNALHGYEAAFGIRQISAYVFPSTEHGLNTPCPTCAGDWGGTIGAVTPAGASTFPELVGPVPIENQSWGYESTIVDPAIFTTLATGKNGVPMVGIYTHPEDGRQELVVTVDANQYGRQGLLLPDGMLRWVTKGVHLGHKRAYFNMHFDDVFIDNDRWDTVANVTPEPSPRPIRMRASDVLRAGLWEAQNKLRMDLVFNGEGAKPGDFLTLALLFGKGYFGWINHTFTHPNLDGLSQAQLENEIKQNIDFAKKNKLPNWDATELVTGEHSGLANLAMPAALTATGIKYVGDDNSRFPAQRLIGPALTLPRYPSNVYYNVGTRAEQLDEYNYVYLPPALGGNCTNTPTTTCFTAPATWEQYVNNEATQMFQHLFANEPKPHYFHQSNLAEDGVFYPVVNELLTRYRAYMKPLLVQVGMKDAALTIQRFDKWRAALASGQVSAYLQNNQVFVTSSVAIDVPVTGTGVGDVWGGDRAGWQHLEPGQTVTLTPATVLPPAAVNAVSGEPVIGSTLTAPTVAGDAFFHVWVRCNATGEACGPISRANAATYAVAADDVAATLRSIVLSRRNGLWSVTRSDPTSLVAGATVPEVATAVNTSAPAVEGTAQISGELTASPGVWLGASLFEYTWSRCEDGSCVAIDGADGRTYRPDDADLGTRLRVAVRALVGEARSDEANSSQTGPVRGTDEALSSRGLTEAKAAEAEAAAEAATAAAGAAAVNSG